jgi:hypothetical protein
MKWQKYNIWIRVQMGQWIRSQAGNPDPDPGRPKLSHEKRNKSQKFCVGSSVVDSWHFGRDPDPWVRTTPLPAGECASPLPFGSGGGAHSFAVEGVGSLNSDEGTYTLWYPRYTVDELGIQLTPPPPLVPGGGLVCGRGSGGASIPTRVHTHCGTLDIQ